jgi:hypothetical protein
MPKLRKTLCYSDAPYIVRLTRIIETARMWLRKEVKCQTVRDAVWDSHLAAKNRAAYPAAEAAARAIANATLTCHVATQSIRVTFYGAAAAAYDRAGVRESPETYDAIAADECARLEAALRAVAVLNESTPVPCKWSDMNNIRRMERTR